MRLTVSLKRAKSCGLAHPKLPSLDMCRRAGNTEATGSSGFRHAMLVVMRTTITKRRTERTTGKARRCECSFDTSTFADAEVAPTGLLQLVGPRFFVNTRTRPLDRRSKALSFHPFGTGQFECVDLKCCR